MRLESCGRLEQMRDRLEAEQGDLAPIIREAQRDGDGDVARELQRVSDDLDRIIDTLGNYT